MNAKSRMEAMDARDSRRGRLSDPVLLDIFMSARLAALKNGASLATANEIAHDAVNAKVKV